ncbi:MAG: Brp/Blh family beta-carotene 15,15'-dioxygenase [Chitinophagaceae bacterium]
MLRVILIGVGIILLFIQHLLTKDVQFVLFVIGIIILGIPHGAADMLVAGKSAATGHRTKQLSRFLLAYLFRLISFALLLYFFPLMGSMLFILFAAYHFGETDLHQFQTETWSGKIFIISYGLLLLGVIILQHFDEVIPLLASLSGEIGLSAQINFINEHRIFILCILAAFFFLATFVYFSNNENADQGGRFLIQYGLVLLIVYQLPLLLGFTFYFVCWHSILSVTNILRYLKKDRDFSFANTARQILVYSLIAIAGISALGYLGMQWYSANGMVMSTFIGLAILTAPHMQIMYDMYKKIRQGEIN